MEACKRLATYDRAVEHGQAHKRIRTLMYAFTQYLIPALILSNSDYTKSIRVHISARYAGSDHTFIVHEDVICRHSLFFKTVCETAECGLEGKFITVIQPPLNVKVYTDWLHTQTNDLSSSVHKVYKEANPFFAFGAEDNMPTCEMLCNLWVLGNHVEDKTFENKVFDCLQKEEVLYRRKLSKGVVSGIIARTKSSSALRVWLVDHLVGLSSQG